MPRMRNAAISRFEGHHKPSTLPLTKGMEVVIPKGIIVKTMHPSRDAYVTKRAQTIKVHHVLPGRSVSLHYALGDPYIRQELQQRGIDLTTLQRQYHENPQDGCEHIIHLENPKVCWSGTGGYWCEADINDLLPLPLQCETDLELTSTIRLGC